MSEPLVFDVAAMRGVAFRSSIPLRALDFSSDHFHRLQCACAHNLRDVLSPAKAILGTRPVYRLSLSTIVIQED